MSGVPVTLAAQLLLAMLLLAPMMAAAQARVIISHAYQLESAPGVAALAGDYSALAGAYVLYEQCGQARGISEERKDYLKKKFLEVAGKYQQAYQDAFVNYVGAPPEQALVNDIAATIAAQQQTAVNAMATQIRKGGCTESRLNKIVKYVETLYAIDTAPPPNPDLLAPKASFGKKH